MTNSNPAWALLEIFNRWKKAGERASTVQDLTTRDGINETATALRCLDAISARLDLLEAQNRHVQVYRDAMDVWFRDVIRFNKPWDNVHQGTSKPDLLAALADMLDADLPALVVGDPETFRASVKDLLNEATEAVKADETLDRYLRNYLTDALAHARTCLDLFEASGVFDIGRALKDLEVLMHAAKSMSRDANRWESVLTKMSAFFTNPTIAALAGSISGSLVSGAITTG
ncbi:hypothetical protein [Actinomyces procaprae]|uniref:hypothetical protein n=1 Tax=Actinomyces procaprae TaxID=2560010 RepID=UPI0010A2185E|nr:hypothetical protein [Actinomyces procaprae]